MRIFSRIMSYSGILCIAAAATNGIGVNVGLATLGVGLMMISIWEDEGRWD